MISSINYNLILILNFKRKIDYVLNIGTPIQ